MSVVQKVLGVRTAVGTANATRVTIDRRVGQSAGQTVCCNGLLVVLLRTHLIAAQHGHRPIMVLEVRCKDEFSTSTDTDTVRLQIRSQIILVVSPRNVLQRSGEERGVRTGIDIEVNTTVESQTAGLWLNTQQFVLDIEVWCQAVGLILLPSLIGNSNGVAQITHSRQLIGRVVAIVGCHTADSAIHDVELVGVIAETVLTIDTHIGSNLLGDTQQTGIILVIARIGQREVRREANAVRHIVVQNHAGGELLELLLDD